MRPGAFHRTVVRRCFGSVFGNFGHEELASRKSSSTLTTSSLPSSPQHVERHGTVTAPLTMPSSLPPATLSPSSQTTSGSSNALGEPLVPRVLSWYKPNSPFHMPRVLEVLEQHGVVPECWFPVAAAPSPTAGGTSSSSGSKPNTATMTTSATSFAPQPPSSSSSSSAKLEVVAFSFDPVAVNNYASPANSSPSSSSSPFSRHRSGNRHARGAIPVRTTYFVFADGSIVGWNALWEDLVAMRELLTQQHSGGSGRDSGKTVSLSTPSPAAASTPPTPPLFSATSTPTSSNAAMSVESMRYQLFLTLPMSERPADAEPQEAQTYIDALRDRIVLADDSDISKKLSYSFALVQSVKLDAMHTHLEPVSQVVKNWQQELSIDGRLVCTLKQLRKAKTNLLALNEALNFGHMHVQTTTPRIFWAGEYHGVRGLYRDACDHLEIDDRTASLKAQMESLDETLSYLHDEAHASENEWLTWVIIILIAFEALAALGVFERVMGALIDLWYSTTTTTPAITPAALPPTPSEGVAQSEEVAAARDTQTAS